MRASREAEGGFIVEEREEGVARLLAGEIGGAPGEMSGWEARRARSRRVSGSARGSKSSARAVGRGVDATTRAGWVGEALVRCGVARAAAAAATPRMVSASMTRGVGRSEGVASSYATRRASTPSPRAVSSASATVFTPGVMEPKAPFNAYDRALASHACLRGDDVDSGDSASPAFRGPSGVTSNDDAFAGAARGQSSGVACMARESLLRELRTPSV